MNPVARAMDLNSLLAKNLSINNIFNQCSYQNHNNYRSLGKIRCLKIFVAGVTR